MSERQNTVICTFDHKIPRISTFDIHEWIFEHLHVPENPENMIQIDGPLRQVYIKFAELQGLHEVLHSTDRQSEYKHENGQMSHVKIEMAGMGTKRVRLANLPPETADEAVRLAFSTYGEIKEIQEEMWPRAYQYQIANGIRAVLIALTKHIPSHMTIAGNSISIL
jgi:hypothetical protein